MTTGFFNSAQLAALYQELERECAEFTRENGQCTAAQYNLIVARLLEEARNSLPPTSPVVVIGPHGT